MRLQVCKFLGRQHKCEIIREPVKVAANLFVQATGAHSVELRKVSVEQYLLTTNQINFVFDTFQWNDGIRGLEHVGNFIFLITMKLNISQTSVKERLRP